MRAPVQAGRRGRSSFVPPNRFRQRPFWPAGIRTDAAIPVLVVDVHGKQNGAIYQEVTFGRSDIAPVSLLVEDRADVLECLINGKHGDHSSTSTPMRTATDAWPGQGLWSSLWGDLITHEDQPEPELRLRPRRARGPVARVVADAPTDWIPETSVSR